MLSSTLRLLLVAALTLPTILSGQDCKCTVSLEKVGYTHYTSYSEACYSPDDACGITLEPGVVAFLWGFNDLRDDTVKVAPYSLPLLLSSALVNNKTHFIVETDPEDYRGVSNLPLAVALLQILNCGVDRYNELLRECDGVCTIGMPNVSSVAPITLLSWNTEIRGDKVELQWETSDETENDYYLVSHSTDGKSFTEIGTVGGSGTTETLTSYRYRHAPTEAGFHYYRLRQYDYDGTFADLGVQAVEIKPTVSRTELSVSPNPVASGQRMTVHGDLRDNVDAILYDNSGQEIARIPVQSSSFRVPSLRPGIYVLRIDGESSRLVVAR